MQVSKEQLQHQQIVLAQLGYYKHKCDGIWGPASIEAKLKFEGTKEFNPALPNRGLPFAEKVKYPKGVFMGQNKLLTCDGLTPERIKELCPNPVNRKKPEPVVEAEIPVIPKTDNAPVIENAPVKAPSNEDTPGPDVGPDDTPGPTEKSSDTSDADTEEGQNTVNTNTVATSTYVPNQTSFKKNKNRHR